jgi:hypothetical protein
MKFFSTHLSLRMLGLEDRADVVEVEATPAVVAALAAGK